MVNKKEFIELISIKLSISKKQAESYVVAIADTLEDVLKKSEKFRFLNFGTFSVIKRAARIGINPSNQKPVSIPAKKVLKFKASSALAGKIAKF